MSHNYLFVIHHFIEQQLASAAAAHKKAEDGACEKFFAEGRLNAMMEFQEYISTNINPKLPKRLYKRLA